MRTRLNTVFRSKKGLSPIIGMVLLLGITILLVVVMSASFMTYAEQVEEPPAFFSDSRDIEFDVGTNDIQGQYLIVTRGSGQSVSLDNLDVIIETDDQQTRIPATQLSDQPDESWSAGEPLSLNLSTETVCTGSNEITVTLIQSTGSRSYVFGEETIPIVVPQFIIEDGQMVPHSSYSVDMTVIGTGFTYGAYGPDIDIATEVTIGNTTYVPWAGNVNDNQNPRSHTFTDQPANAGISVAAIGDPHGEYITPRTRTSTNTDDGWVYVLRDGDSSPDIEGFGNQKDVDEYLEPYLDGNGSVSLEGNEAIFLFELGNSQEGAAADYQDIVVLASLTPQPTHGTENTNRDMSGSIMCPAE